MCAPASLIITRERVFWSRQTDSHEPIIAEFGLTDEVANQITLVRVEIKPPQGADGQPDFAAPLEQWQYRVDQDLLPDWYQKDPAKHEERARAALVDWHAAKVFLSGHHNVTSGNCFAGDNSTVRAGDNSTVRAGDNSTVRAGDNSTVEAWGNSTVRAGDNSNCIIYGCKSCELHDQAAAIDRRGEKVKLLLASTKSAKAAK
jgi:hypothetical protein